MLIDPQFWFFRKLQLQERLPDKVVEALRAEGRLERWGHQAMVHHHDDLDEVYVVLQGSVYVHDGAGAAAARLKPGDVFGARDGAGDDGKIMAFDDTMLVAVDRQLFDEEIAPKLGHQQVAFTTVRGRRNVAVPIAPLLYTTPSRRLARALLHLSQTAGSVRGDHAELPWRFRKRAFARLLGLDPLRTQPPADILTMRGLVRLDRSSIVVPSLEELERYAVKGT